MKFLKSKLFQAAGSLVLVALMVVWGREAWHRREVEREIEHLREQIEEAEGGSAKLQEALAYLRTPEYKERQARQLLGLQKPGEFVVALPPAEEESAGSPGAGRGGNPRQWWLYFFGNK